MWHKREIALVRVPHNLTRPNHLYIYPPAWLCTIFTCLIVRGVIALVLKQMRITLFKNLPQGFAVADILAVIEFWQES